MEDCPIIVLSIQLLYIVAAWKTWSAACLAEKKSTTLNERTAQSHSNVDAVATTDYVV